jgi:hypothetical protein
LGGVQAWFQSLAPVLFNAGSIELRRLLRLKGFPFAARLLITRMKYALSALAATSTSSEQAGPKAVPEAVISGHPYE